MSEGRAAVMSVGQRCVPVWGARQMACMLGPPPASQVCHGVGGVPGGPVLLPLGWLPAVDRAQARRVVLGAAGFLWGSGPVPCAGVRCRGVARAGCPSPLYSWGWAWLRSQQATPGVPVSPGRVVLCWLLLRRPFGRTLLWGALWRASPKWCRIACSPRGVGGRLLVCCGEGWGGARRWTE